jgi:hypothetical protein
VGQVSGTTLADWLRAQDDDALVALLRTRPDLATPPPPDLSVLATRIGTRSSLARVCEDLDTFTLTALDGLVVLDADVRPVPLADLVDLLRAPVPNVTRAVALLRARGVLWGADDELRVPPAAREAAGPFPGGLGRSAPHLDPAALPGQLAELAESERRLLETLAAGPPIGATRDAGHLVPLDQARTPVQRLLALGLLLRRDPNTVELPREVGLVLRGDRPMGRVEVAEPSPRTTEPGKSTVDNTAGGAALELVRHTESLLALWSEEPPPVLRSGGLGVRELRRAARHADVDETRAALLTEVLVAAGLVADSEGVEPEWVPTTTADAWLVSSTEQRWTTLAQAWLDLPRLPGLVGRRDERDRLLNPLAPELRRAAAPRDRRWVLGALAGLPDGVGVPDPAELAAVLAWRAPRRGGRLRDDLVRWTLEEGTALAVVALGAVSSAGRALLADGPAAGAKQLADALPAPIDHVLVQADLTVVAPGPLEPELAAEIALVADVESAGGATVYRVGETSVRRALDAGRTAGDLHELFRTRSRTPIPQSLTYLIDDVARRHGRLRGGSAGSFLRCDDDVLVTEVLAHPEADRLGLRRIAPTVLVSPLPLVEVLDGLRAAGFAPAAEGPDGRVLDLRPSGRRVPGRRAGRNPVLPTVPSDEQLAEVVRHARAGDHAAATPRGAAVSVAGGLGAGPSAVLALLHHAVRDQRRVSVAIVDGHGTATQRVVEPVSVGAGVLEGYDHTYGEVRRYPLHRITSAALVDN